MADINLTQVIHNVKEAYVDLTGDTDEITYGNISTKISEIQTGGGGGYGGVSVVPIQSIAEAMPTNTTVTV
jgi:hypothetical protein